MPIYEYRCETCGRVFEYQQKITDLPLTSCPKEICQNDGQRGKGKVHRIISKGIGLIFKGNGFYITDYSRKHSSIVKSESKDTASKNGASAIETQSKSN